MRNIGLIAASAMLLLAVGACDGSKKAATGGKEGATLETAGAVTPVPLPDSPSFPVPAATINGWIANSDTAAIRAHAWSLWQAMTAPSGQSVNNQQLPIWDTWADTSVVFPQPQATNASLTAEQAKPSPGRKFFKPAQFHHTRDARLKALATAAADNFPLAVDSKYDPPAATFIGGPQAGPGGGTYSYASGASLTKLNAAWPTGTTPQNRAINEFPIRAIETKPVFGLVKANGLTAQPLWQGPSASTNAGNPTPDTWTTCVLIQPGATGAVRPATSAEINAGAVSVQAQGLACKTFLWAPLSTFYAAQLNAAEAQNFNAATGVSGPAAAAAGDYSVLLAMHVNTKEIPFWTWQTYWWQPGADTPNNFPGSKQGQPGALGGPWNNYASCTAYDQTTTPGGSTMQVCFNPYLETSPGIPAGVTSNCVSCHGVALVGPNPNYPANYNKPIVFFTDPTYFNTQSTHTDFSWAVASAP
ncbi:hypothetical protein ASD21_10110 [Caulobacter sp. Root1455]|uniref:hypothetical protein n=1 Tax=unclassified Caulobacter TaxID=2648921 RepID=UPI0006F6784B|nr:MULTISPECIES: hypothetical protein [unclassified Caulobacter]KQY27606.1 hypothetical protein ASD38_17010 [Caulobacter sp. Root487D2Y]KQY93928.1 hypothetical protein ASD21_10110 [Caulobacter sp. Root1455]